MFTDDLSSDQFTSFVIPLSSSRFDRRVLQRSGSDIDLVTT